MSSESSIRRLLKRSRETLQSRGLLGFLKKVRGYLKGQMVRRVYSKRGIEMEFIDVLFVNGCYLPHPSRYRVDHQIEQLRAQGLAAKSVFCTKIKTEMLKYTRLVVLFRCAHTPELEAFVQTAKSLNKTILFDIDDLVIDECYTKTIKYLSTMPADEKAAYDDGVRRINKMMLLCDGLTTTTEALAAELRKYNENVFINRNVASDQMLACSEQAHVAKLAAGGGEGGGEGGGVSQGRLRIGYFSGSITHNADIEMILPVLQTLLQNHSNLDLYFMGELDVPSELEKYRSEGRIVALPFCDWRQLPAHIAAVDINIAPLEPSIFNEAKSENRWLEAALVKVPTVASNLGAFARMVVNDQTGLLCTSADDWLLALERLLGDSNLRSRIGNTAYEFAINNCLTLTSGRDYAAYIKSQTKQNIAFVLPTTELSGGIRVVYQHASMLAKAGKDVFVIHDNKGDNDVCYDSCLIPVLHAKDVRYSGWIDHAVATLWSTTEFFATHAKIGRRSYLVQNYETGFFETGEPARVIAEASYNSAIPMQAITISLWCKNWLEQRYKKVVRYAPNGINTKMFLPDDASQDVTDGSLAQSRDSLAQPDASLTQLGSLTQPGERVRVLIEGNSNDHYKNVGESFAIAALLDPAKYEIWYMSYEGKPKRGWRVDKFYHRIPLEQVAEVYRNSHILLKSSKLESFSYPPLEMMATGGFVVVAPNDGNIEYCKDEVNCLFYQPGDAADGARQINRIVADQQLRQKLRSNGLRTAQERDWCNLEASILALYE